MITRPRITVLLTLAVAVVGLILVSFLGDPVRAGVDTLRGAGAEEFYVSTEGDDTNPGTIDQPWRTIQHAADSVEPGSTVYVRGGEYNERVTINVSGSASAGYTTFRSYAEENAILDGTGLTVPAEETALFLIADQSYLVIEGFELRNYRTSTPQHTPAGIHIMGSSHHIELRGNRIHNIASTAPVDEERLGADAHGIAVHGTDAPASINNILIDDNELYDLTLGSSEAVILNGNVEVFTVTNNVIHDVDNIALDFTGFYEVAPDPAYDQARDGLVAANTIFNVSSFGNPAYGDVYAAGGIYVDGGRDIVVERNTVYQADIGIEFASEHSGRSTSGIVARSNLIFNNRIAGIAMGGYDRERGSTEDCRIINNTLVENDTEHQGNGELFLQFDVRDSVIQNNIFQANDQNFLIGNAYDENTNNLVDYNLYFAPAGAGESVWLWRDVYYEGFAAYQEGTGNDANSLFADPQFAGAPDLDFHLLGTSPAVDTGELIPAIGPFDIDGQERVLNGQVDRGADEFHDPDAVTPTATATTPTTTPTPTTTTTPDATSTPTGTGTTPASATTSPTFTPETTATPGGDLFLYLPLLRR